MVAQPVVEAIGKPSLRLAIPPSLRLKGGVHSLIETVNAGVDLSLDDVRAAVAWLADPAADPAAKEVFLERLHQKGESAGEIAAFAESLVGLAVDTGIRQGDLSGPVLDVCGTGGDRLELFNISTTSMFLLAAGGAVVVKHGNRAITSKCGGADVLEALGVSIEMPPARLSDCVQRHGIGFVFAPAYHPAFRAIAPVRKALAARGVPTIFNLLGPLLNPVRPAHQLVGVYAENLLPKYGEALLRLGRKRAWAVHGSGADELTLAGAASGVAVENAALSPIRVDPRALGLGHAPVEALRGGERSENARLLVSILEGGESGPCTDVVLLNAAAGFVVAGLCPGLPEGMERAREVLASGAALAKLRALQSAS